MRFFAGSWSAVCLCASLAWAEPPQDPAALKIYDHNKKWLAHSPPAFVAANIRGRGNEYAERRQAALDLVQEQRDFGVVSELMQALEENSFLSGQIIDILTDWKAKRALPLLRQISADAKRDAAIREKARLAAIQIAKTKPDQPPRY